MTTNSVSGQTHAQMRERLWACIKSACACSHTGAVARMLGRASACLCHADARARKRSAREGERPPALSVVLQEELEAQLVAARLPSWSKTSTQSACEAKFEGRARAKGAVQRAEAKGIMRNGAWENKERGRGKEKGKLAQAGRGRCPCA
eukprot:6191016-Pleurochrysis_carterae.AAC.8